MKKSALLLMAVSFSLTVGAQSSAVKKTANSVFTLTTFKEDGSIKDSSHGVFISETGEAVGAWTPFAGAASAVVVDNKGQKHDVETVIGANELYDICKFRVSGKTVPVKMATSGAASGSKVWMINNAGGKTTTTQLSVDKNEKFMNKYSYYIFSDKPQGNVYGCPILNDNGLLLGILQPSQSGDGLHATDAMLVDSIKTIGLSINDPVLRQTSIRIEMPKEKDQATLLLMMAAGNTDSTHYAKYIEDFIGIFPTAIEGYVARAQSKMGNGDYEGTKADMELAIKNADNKADAHAEWSRLMYQKLVLTNDSTFTLWTFDDALKEAQTAYSIDPQPAYKHREAQIVYTQGDYSKAYDMFMNLTSSKLRNGELFYEAAQCKMQLKAPSTEIVELLDSSIAVCPKPLNNIAAPYVLARAQILDGEGVYRKALQDYNLYDSLMVGRASDTFYYTRYQCEMKVKQYQQALNDVAHAAFINPSQPLYLAELASLQLRFNRFEDAVKAADLCLRVAPESTDSYIIKGVALIQLNKKEEGMQALEKAKELGDSRADDMIKKYK